MTDFTNGATVFRIWSDGSGEVIAKFQYRQHAESFAKTMADADGAQRCDCTHFYTAVCEAENSLRSYRPAQSPQGRETP